MPSEPQKEPSGASVHPREPWLWAGAVVVVAAGLYFATAAETILGGDNAELVTLAERGGVAHPSGYPLYVLYLGALSWLPLGSPAHVAALATSLLGLATVALLYAAARRWGASPAAAAGA